MVDVIEMVTMTGKIRIYRRGTGKTSNDLYINREPCISNKTRNNSLEHLFDVKQKDMFTANISLN